MSKANHYDTIVIGAGMTGGWAAKEFCEQGFKTLLIDRGRNVEHPKDYPTTNMLPWEFKHRGAVPAKAREENPIASSCYAFKEDAMHFFVKDCQSQCAQRPTKLTSKVCLRFLQKPPKQAHSVKLI